MDLDPCQESNLVFCSGFFSEYFPPEKYQKKINISILTFILHNVPHWNLQDEPQDMEQLTGEKSILVE